MLQYRLVFGTLLGLGLVAIVLLDGWLDGSLTANASDDRSPEGLLFLAMVCGLVIMAHMELSAIIRGRQVMVPTLFLTAASVVFCTMPYWPDIGHMGWGGYACAGLVFTLVVILGYYGLGKGPDGALVGTGVGLFAVLYLGLQCAFVVAIRLAFGVWVLLMYIWVVKGADIGAFTVGRLLGRRKLIPIISPGKTWEGLVGGIGLGVLVAVVFAYVFAIMNIWYAIWFGICFAVLGQIGDLSESVIKRDGRIKDTSCLVPGFGGILDLVDSTLVPAPWAYLFFLAIGLGR